uniref:Uncharacterized protein n=1 Tax=Arundo donax TaxID=35708 RepID=A0A0A9DE52_ARUDO
MRGSCRGPNRAGEAGGAGRSPPVAAAHGRRSSPPGA